MKILLQLGLLLISVCFSMVVAIEAIAGAGYQASPASPIGGGPGYHAPISIDSSTTTVTTTSQFTQALDDAATGGNLKIFIPSNITLQLLGAPNSYTIPYGVTIFSDRGVNGSLGGKLKYAEYDNGTTSFVINNVESYVTLSGLRIEGPSGEADPSLNFLAYGFKQSNGTAFKVFNNDISAWPGAAIAIDKSDEAEVKYNYIHDNRRSQRGYGVVVQGGNAIADINYNLFNNNRHSIAGSGKAGEEWYANYNVQLAGSNGHAFDMHKFGSNGGKHVEAHSNLFLIGSTCWGHREAFNIRGIPTNSKAKITGNWFKTSQSFVDCGNRDRKTVKGINGAVSSDYTLNQYNSFEAGVVWTQHSSTDCEVTISGSYNNASLPIHCTGYSLAQ
jgi:hypothetical protein